MRWTLGVVLMVLPVAAATAAADHPLDAVWQLTLQRPTDAPVHVQFERRSQFTRPADPAAEPVAGTISTRRIWRFGQSWRIADDLPGTGGATIFDRGVTSQHAWSLNGSGLGQHGEIVLVNPARGYPEGYNFGLEDGQIRREIWNFATCGLAHLGGVTEWFELAPVVADGDGWIVRPRPISERAEGLAIEIRGAREPDGRIGPITRVRLTSEKQPQQGFEFRGFDFRTFDRGDRSDLPIGVYHRLERYHADGRLAEVLTLKRFEPVAADTVDTVAAVPRPGINDGVRGVVRPQSIRDFRDGDPIDIRVPPVGLVGLATPLPGTSANLQARHAAMFLGFLAAVAVTVVIVLRRSGR